MSTADGVRLIKNARKVSRFCPCGRFTSLRVQNALHFVALACSRLAPLPANLVT